MGLLGNFLLGAGGDGLNQVVKNQDARDAQAAALAEKRDYLKMMLEKAQIAADARTDSAYSRDATRIALAGEGGAGGGTRSASGARSGGAGVGNADAAEAQARAALGEQGMTDAQIDQFIAAKKGNATNPIMGGAEDRDGNAMPDEEKFTRLMKVYNGTLRRAVAGGNADIQAKAAREDMVTDAGRGVMTAKDPVAAGGLLGRAVAGMEGKGATKEAGNVMYDQFAPPTQGAVATPVGKAVINKDNASAGEHTAGAEKKRADMSGEGFDRQRKALTDTVDKAQGRLDRLVQGASEIEAKKIRNGPEYQAAKTTLERANADLAAHDTRKADARPAPAGGPAPKADSFQVGKVYKDAKGQRAKYLGNGKWGSA